MITYHWLASNFLFLKETDILVGSQLICCMLYPQLMDWCDYFVHLLINQTANLLLSTPLFKQKPNTEEFLSRWRAYLQKTLKVVLFVMLILAEWCFWWKGFYGGIGPLKLSLIKWRIFWFWSLVALDILLYFLGLKKTWIQTCPLGKQLRCC